MKFSDKLYKWFYTADKRPYRSRILPNMIGGATSGLISWLFSLLVDRFIGLNGTFYWYLPHFVTGGFIVGAIIGRVSNEMLWHRYMSDHHKKE